MKKRYFGFLEMLGSIVLLLIDPNRRDTKKYLNPKYLKTNRLVGILTVLAILGIILVSGWKIWLK